MPNLFELLNFMKAAVECSYYVDPATPGLTQAELFEICRAVGYKDGEVSDSIGSAALEHGPRGRLMPDHGTKFSWKIFAFAEEPDYRNIEAFDFILSEIHELARERGARQAKIDRSVVLERGVAKGLPRHDLEVAIAISTASGMLNEKEGALSSPLVNSAGHMLPSEVRGQPGAGSREVKPWRAKAYPVVQDVLARRVDGRPSSAEPLDAFAERLSPLGYGQFRMWWVQTVAELRRLDPGMSPAATCVFSAALVEGALTFVVKHGRAQALGIFASSDFDRSPRSWKIDDLVASAATGRGGAILDEIAKVRAQSLIRTRQRIHAGRMLDDFPGGVPDLRPEEARDARATADLVVRKVLDWLDLHPPVAS